MTSTEIKNNRLRRLIAVLAQRCPRCLQGHVYHGYTTRVKGVNVASVSQFWAAECPKLMMIL